MDNKEENGPAKSKPGSSTTKSQRKSPTSSNSLKELEKLDSYNNEILNRIKQVLEQNSRVLLIMRGLPGSGKSTLAKQTVFNGVIVSADSYFTNLNGVYVYDQFKISDAHQSCKTRALEAMKKGVSPVIIDNTNIKIWEFQPYVSMGVKYKYHIELIEPNTPWKFKPKLLSEKNIHGVNLNKIKNSLDDYDVNVDLKRLIEDCKSDLPPSSSQTRPKLKPGSIIGNFEEFANKVDWEIDEYPSLFDNQSESTPKSSGLDLTNLLEGTEKTDVTEIESESKSEIAKEAKELLNQMFPNVDDEILVDFLIKYDNNVARVTDILLDSICFEEIKKESHKPKPKPKKVKSLKTLCNEVMERLEIQFENLYENSSNVDVCFSLKEEEESLVEEISSNSNVENEPIFSFNLDSDFLSSIIKIFGEKDDEKYLNDVNRVDIGINLAQQLYTAWKKTNPKDDGFVKSEKKLVKSKSEQTFRSQPNSRVDWEKEKEPSLREIMDEELAIEIMSKEMYPHPVNFSSKENQTPTSTKSRNSHERNYANLVKIDILKRKYEKIVDNQAIEEIFRNKEYDLDKTMQHIEEIFCLVSVKDPINRFDLSKKSQKSQENNQNADFSRSDCLVSNTKDSHKDYDKNRQEAQKHAQIRQDYFEKASEAHARGWGAVAQYYAEMGHFETKKIKSENQTASAKILSTNNTDMRISNTLDLHGLHVDEAISVLKKCLNEKRNEYYSSNNTKKRKTYIFVITGFGHHSKSGPKLRPNIINFLNQKGIRYNEPHIGLLKVDFLS